jgi:hypothetical protein
MSSRHAVGNPKLDEANIGIAKYLMSRGGYGEAEMPFGQAGQERCLGLTIQALCGELTSLQLPACGQIHC